MMSDKTDYTPDIASLYQELGVRKEVLEFGREIEAGLKERFAAIDETAEYNQLKVIHAMQSHRVSAECFMGSSGYGYNVPTCYTIYKSSNKDFQGWRFNSLH